MAVAILFTASCAKEDISSSIGGGEVEMTFTVDLPELGTRAYGNGANATLLRYYVFDAANGAELEALRGTATRTSGNFTFTLPLLKGMKYNIALWADQNVGSVEAPVGYYDFDGKVVTVDYVNANDNNRDAFYHYEPNFDPTNPRTTTFTLYRPFAQLNAAVVNSDIEAVAKNGVTLETSSVEVTTYTQFNLATGDVVESSKTVVNTFTATDMPYEAGETLKSGYTYLSMNYILAPKAGSVSDVTFTFNNNKNINFGATYTNVPLKQNFRTNILGALLTAPTNFTVEIEAEFNKADQIVATDAAAAQEALDNAVPGTVIKLKSGVNYGTLYLRPTANPEITKVVDWQGNNYRHETYSLYENVTIIGAPNAVVDVIAIEGGTYYNTNHSQAATYPIMLSLIELKNFVIDGVTFTGNGNQYGDTHGNAISLAGNNIKVDGLTLKNCILKDPNNNNRLLYKSESTTHVHTYTYDGNTFTFTPSLKDITVTGCTFNGGYMGLELRETENITITNNEFNVANRNILLPVNSGRTYTGNVTITGNISNNAKERFVRMSGAGDAVVVIKDNIINNYLGTDADYIKVTDGTNVTIENNTLITPIAGVEGVGTDSNGNYVVSADEGIASIGKLVVDGNDFAGKTIVLGTDIDLAGVAFTAIGYDGSSSAKLFKGTFDGQGHTIKNLSQQNLSGAYKQSVGLFAKVQDATFKNITVEDFSVSAYGPEAGVIATWAIGDCTFENITVKNGDVVSYNCETGGVLGWAETGNFTFKNITVADDVTVHSLWDSYDTPVGGVIGGVGNSSGYSMSVTLENINVNCKLSVYNDVCSNYQWGAYRRAGMLIGNIRQTQNINGTTYPNPSAENVTCTNVTVTYGEWMNYHYCEFKSNGHGSYDDEFTWKCNRVESSDWGSDGINTDNCNHESFESHNMCLPFDQLFGGGQGVYGLREYPGVTVNYPAEYTCPTCGQQHNVQ